MTNKFFAVFGKLVLVVIILGALAFGAFYLGTKNNSQLISQNKPLATPSVTLNQSPTVTPPADETSAIILAVKNGLISAHGTNAASMAITVSNIIGDFAKGMANAQGGGGIWFAAKTNGTWKLVWDGNGIIQCSSLVSYTNFPVILIPQCFDDKTQQLIKR